MSQYVCSWGKKRKRFFWNMVLMSIAINYSSCFVWELCHGFITAVGQITNTSTICLLLKASLISLRRPETLAPNCFMELYHTRCTNAMCWTRYILYIFLPTSTPLFNITPAPSLQFYHNDLWTSCCHFYGICLLGFFTYLEN